MTYEEKHSKIKSIERDIYQLKNNARNDEFHIKELKKIINSYGRENIFNPYSFYNIDFHSFDSLLPTVIEYHSTLWYIKEHKKSVDKELHRKYEELKSLSNIKCEG